MRRFSGLLITTAVAAAVVLPSLSPASEKQERCSIWVDLYSGEPARYEEILDDLMLAKVIYLGERHTLVRHHDIQEQIIRGLAARGVELAIGLEMLPAVVQAAADEYNSGYLGFDDLAQEVAWEGLWNNYEQYRGAIEAGREAGAPILALNAESDLVTEVARKGFAGLDPGQAARLPAQINTDQPDYQRELSRVMMVMAHVTGDTDMLTRMFEAQVTRDETMAEGIARFLKSPPGEGRTVVVLCGSGHVSYGYGIPSRVRARIPDIIDRIVILSESGDVVLSEREKAMARAIEVTHAQLRENTVPIADYLHAKALAPEAEVSEPGIGEAPVADPGTSGSGTQAPMGQDTQ
jgi:uncharacterized iron-regulated protein